MTEKKLLINKVKNSGLILEDPNPKDYQKPLYFGIAKEPIRGTVSPLKEPPIIFPNGIGWHDVALRYGNPEIQFNKNFDTFSCVVFGIAKQLCYYLFKVYGVKVTVAEMYNAFYAGVIQNRGTTVRNGMESFRKKGWVEDHEYPFTKNTTAKEFFSEPPKQIQIMAEGKLTLWDFHWEVLPPNLKAIIEAYKRTPVGLTGFAWASYYGDTGVYYDDNNQANHYFVGLEELPNGNNLIDDTYPKNFEYKENPTKDELFKELHKSFKYGSAHRCWLTPAKNLSLINKFMDYFRRLKNGAIYWGKANTNKLQKITPQNAGLAAITHLTRMAGQDVRTISEKELEDYNIGEEHFGSDKKLGIAKNLLKS